MGKCDVVLKLSFGCYGKINLEMNIGFFKGRIVRNTGYVFHHFSSYLKSNEDYGDIKPILQINFDTHGIDKNNKNIVDIYTLKNDNCYELTNLLQIYHINIAKCYKYWYNKTMEGYSEVDKNIIKMCALIYASDEANFTKCIGEINMEEKIKRNFLDTMDELCSDEELENYYGSEEDIRKTRKADMDIMKREIRESATKSGMRKGMKLGKQKGIEQGIKQGIEQGIKQGIKQLIKQGTDES